MNNLPTARVDDILVHPRDSDLIVATHARGIWIADDISPLQQLAGDAAAGSGALRRAARCVVSQRSAELPAGRRAEGVRRREPGARRGAELLPAVSGNWDVKIAIADATGRVVRTLDGTRNAGINRVMWNLPRTAARRGGVGARLAAHQSNPERTWPRSRRTARPSASPCRCCRMYGSGRDETGSGIRDPGSGIRDLSKTSRSLTKSFRIPDPGSLIPDP